MAGASSRAWSPGCGHRGASGSRLACLFAALLVHCNSTPGGPTEGAAPASSATATASAAAVSPSATAPSPSTGPSAVDLKGDLTSPVTSAVPSLKEAVSSLTRTIGEYGGQLGVAILDVQSGELLAAQND